MNSKINKFIKGICLILNIKLPNIYYIKNDDSDHLQLFDRDLKNIPYNCNNVYKVRSTLFVPKEYSLYINMALFDKPTKCKILLIRKLRYIYQIKQVKNMMMKDEISENKDTIHQWKCSMELKEDFTLDSSIIMDQNAFCTLIMEMLYNITPKFEMTKESEVILKKRLEELKLIYGNTMLIKGLMEL